MSHQLDINDGVASFVGRQSAWHQLGDDVGECFDAETAMKRGHLGGWNVRKVPRYISDGKGGFIEMPWGKAVVRDNPVIKGQIDVLGSRVGDGYQIIQNEEHAEFLNNLVDESGSHFETAGALNGGSQVFITMKMPGHILVGGVDQVDNYIAAINDHSGGMSFTLMVTPIQIVCKNTLNLAFSQASNIVRIKHTKGAMDAVQTQVREALDLTFDYLDGFQEQAERMINTTMTSAQFEAMIREEFGVGEDATGHARTRAEKKLDIMQELFDEAETVAAKRNTVWGGLAALTEYADHFSETRGKGEAQTNARAMKAVMDPKFKNRALRLMMSAVK